MGEGTDARPFQVDLRGVVDLLSRHIYSSPRVYLRELLQNGRDAIRARAELTGAADPAWGIRITPADDTGTFVLSDDGVGLTADEVGDLLSTVGRSGKRDIFDLPRSDYLGQFGIGLLSCFMVAEDIVIRSRSARGGPPIEWRGHGAGTFTVRELDVDLPIGTSVHLRAEGDAAPLLRRPLVVELATAFGEYLPVPIVVEGSDGHPIAINRAPVFTDPAAADGGASPELAQLGREVVGSAPFAAIPLHVPATDTRGTAFVLPYAPPPGARQSHRVYLGGMLLGERVDEVLPDWAFFARAVIDSTGLNPTASREDLVADEALEYTRRELGNLLRAWVLDLGVSAPHRLAEFVAIHQVALKSLVRYDDELARFITRWLPLETSAGTMSVERLVRRFPRLRYTETVDEFRQVASFARADAPVVNGGYVYDTELVQRLPELFDGVTVERVDVLGELDHLSAPPLADRAAAISLEDRASAVLEACDAVVRVFDTHDVPALYVVDPETFRAMDRQRARDGASGPWASVLGNVDASAAAARSARGQHGAGARLCLNWNNPLIRTLASTTDDAVFSRAVRILHVQALLDGHHPLGADERRVMTESLSELVALSVGLGAALETESPGGAL